MMGFVMAIWMLLFVALLNDRTSDNTTALWLDGSIALGLFALWRLWRKRWE